MTSWGTWYEDEGGMGVSLQFCPGRNGGCLGSISFYGCEYHRTIPPRTGHARGRLTDRTAGPDSAPRRHTDVVPTRGRVFRAAAAGRGHPRVVLRRHPAGRRPRAAAAGQPADVGLPLAVRDDPLRPDVHRLLDAG